MIPPPLIATSPGLQSTSEPFSCLPIRTTTLVAPAAPGGPWGPVTGAKALFVAAASFAGVIAPRLICLAPTLFFGSCEAA